METKAQDGAAGEGPPEVGGGKSKSARRRRRRRIAGAAAGTEAKHGGETSGNEVCGDVVMMGAAELLAGTEPGSSVLVGDLSELGVSAQTLVLPALCDRPTASLQEEKVKQLVQRGEIQEAAASLASAGRAREAADFLLGHEGG